jgi:AcrR family transcriptional regulator
MQTMEKRQYHQTRRAEAAEATRNRILAAASDQLVTEERFTIDAVALRAGVSRMTVYAQFGSSNALREAVFDHLASTGGLEDIPAAFSEADPRDGIDRAIVIFCGFYATHRTVLRRLNALAALHAGAGQRAPDRNQRRRQLLTALVTRVATLPHHRELDVEATAGILHALTSFEFYDQLADNEAASADPARTIRTLASTLFTA